MKILFCTQADVAARALRVSWKKKGSAPDDATVRAALEAYGPVVRSKAGPTHAVVLMAKAADADVVVAAYLCRCRR
jgi:hypothetical protein